MAEISEFAVGQIATVLPALATLSSFLLSVLVLSSVRERSVARASGLFFLLLAGWNFSIGIKTYPSFASDYPSLAAGLNFPFLLIPVAAFQMALAFAAMTDSISRIVLRAAWLASLLFGLLQINGLVFQGYHSYPGGEFATAGPILPAFVAFLCVAVFAACIVCSLGLGSRDEQVQLRCRYWLYGVCALAPLATVNFLVSYGVSIVPMTALGSILVLGVFFYGIYRSDLFAVDRSILRLGEGVLALLAAVVLATVSALRLRTTEWDAIAFAAGVGSLVIVGMLIRRYGQTKAIIESAVELLLFPHRRPARRAARELFGWIAESKFDVGDPVAEWVRESFGVKGAGVYVCDEDGRFTLRTHSGTLVAPESLRFEEARLQQDFAARVDMVVDGVVRGFVAVGAKRSGDALDDADRTLLEMVAAHLGLALALRDAQRQLAEQAAELATLRKDADDEAAAIRAEVRVNPKFTRILGQSPELLGVLHHVEQAAQSELAVLVTGETGTGKELIAQSIHNLSRRYDHPFVCVNCPAIPVDLAEAELFGYERGAFTGATDSRGGRFEEANHGTLFFDEVADLPLGIQTKLLRVLQEQESQRLGSHKIHKLDFRVVAATNRDLHAEVARGRFREDLLHRLAGFELVVPPLRARQGDVLVLSTFFLERAAAALGKPITGLSPDAVDALLRYPWPGNVRELQNVIDRAVLLCSGTVLQRNDLGDLGELGADVDPLHAVAQNGSSLNHALRDEKIRRVEAALARSDGNQAAAARLLGMSRSNLSRLMKRYGIKAHRGRGSVAEPLTASAPENGGAEI